MPVDTQTAPSGIDPSTRRLGHGVDDQCSWSEWSFMSMRMERCQETATDTVGGKLYCSPHADRAAGI